MDVRSTFYLSYIFFSLFPSILFHVLLYSLSFLFLTFRFNVSFLTSFPPLPLPITLPPSRPSVRPSVLSASLLCPNISGSNATRAAFHPPAPGAASRGAVPARLPAPAPRKSRVAGDPSQGLCRAWGARPDPLPMPDNLVTARLGGAT